MKKQRTIDEWEFSNQNWKRILNEISNYAPSRYGRGKNDYGEDHPLVKRLKITPYDLSMSIAFLEEQGLIKYDESEHNWINLTLKGFDVALQNQSANKADRINRASLFLSLAIAIIAVATLLVGISDVTSRYTVTATIAVLFIIAAVVINKMKT